MWIECPLHGKHAEYCSTFTVALEGSHCGHAHFTDEDVGSDSWRMVGQFGLVLKPVNLTAQSQDPRCSSWSPPRGQYQPDLPFGHPHSHKGKRTEYLLCLGRAWLVPGILAWTTFMLASLRPFSIQVDSFSLLRSFSVLNVISARLKAVGGV